MPKIPLRRRTLAAAAAATVLLSAQTPVFAQDLSRLQSLLDATPAGGWVKASTNKYSDAWVTGAAAVPPTPSGPAAIVYAWSSSAWDSTRGDLILWGGGHANYAGNEIYTWDGATGLWGRGSLSSKSIKTLGGDFIIDGAAPQAAHTYDTNTYLPLNDMFVAFGGAAYNTGGNFTTLNGSTVVRAGPWMWDPTKADPNKVGGTTGSGYDPASLGGNMWTNRQGQWTGVEGPSYVNSASAYRQEAGKDVVYLTMDSNSSQFPGLYRYEVGDVRNSGLDSWQKVGTTFNSNINTGAAAIDLNRGLFVRTAFNGNLGDLAVWNLAKSNAARPDLNRDTAVHLVDTNGVPFVMNNKFGIEYDSANDQLLLWSGEQQGLVWSTRPSFTATGAIASTWTVRSLASTTATQPSGNFGNGVLGKWDYVSELGAFVALNEFRNNDAEVWLYKPLAAVPEPGTNAMLALGLAFLLTMRSAFRRKWTGQQAS